MSWEKNNLPNEMSGRISEIYGDANQSADQIAQDTMKGTGDGASLLDGDSFDESIAYSNDGLKRAIQNRSKGDYGRSMQALKTNVNFEAMNRKFDKLKNAAGPVSQEHAHNERARQLRYVERQRKKALRGQLIGSVLGIGGAIGGAMIAPGGSAAGGAIAGNMIGTGLGNTLGGEGM